MNFKLLIRTLFFCLVHFLLSCAGNRVKPAVIPMNIEVPASTLKRQIRDVDFKARLEDKGPKKRIIVLPFIDAGADRPESARLKAREAFLDDLNKSEELIALDSNQLKIDITRYVKSGEYDLAKMAQDSQNIGVSVLVEGKIIDLRVKNQSEKVGIVRNLKTIFEA